jgi:cutinase
MPGPHLSKALKSLLGDAHVAVQGVEYAAGLLQNFLPGGCDAGEASEMMRLITRVADECPSSRIVVSGYSQGAALVHRSIQNAAAAVKSRIAAAVLFGDTQREQDGGDIPGFDPAKTLIICNPYDLVCDGMLAITPAHTDYISSVGPAMSFIRRKLVGQKELGENSI